MKKRDLIDERGTLWLLFLPSLIVVLTTLNMHHRADSLNDLFFFFFSNQSKSISCCLKRSETRGRRMDLKISREADTGIRV